MTIILIPQMLKYKMLLFQAWILMRREQKHLGLFNIENDSAVFISASTKKLRHRERKAHSRCLLW